MRISSYIPLQAVLTTLMLCTGWNASSPFVTARDAQSCDLSIGTPHFQLGLATQSRGEGRPVESNLQIRAVTWKTDRRVTETVTWAADGFIAAVKHSAWGHNGFRSRFWGSPASFRGLIHAMANASTLRISFDEDGPGRPLTILLERYRSEIRRFERCLLQMEQTNPKQQLASGVAGGGERPPA
jgi:hypothetical protein